MYYVYFLTNKTNTTIYIGVTNDLARRISEHKTGIIEGFSKRYRLHKLVYFEEYESIDDAIVREKQLKNWHRVWKLDLIRNNNPKMDDLFIKYRDAESSSA
ncbi:hypothetical protein A2956_01860 [Candidatus Roizmanbacteria bacterium RIFCSPLOWO2_01_FULL_37_57]|nr:MAG: hypothetical protein A2956_01860 [Candidatus Roizmanbacteria bacterium RIFCSPLOWO2_01_FULL_37_57]